MKLIDMWRWAFSDKITWNVTTIPFKEGDTIVLTTDRVLCNEQRTRMAAHVKSYMPEGAKVVVLDGGLKLSVLSDERSIPRPAGSAGYQPTGIAANPNPPPRKP